MPDPVEVPSGRGDVLGELERLVPELPTTTLVELAERLDELVAQPGPQPADVEAALARLLDAR